MSILTGNRLIKKPWLSAIITLGLGLGIIILMVLCSDREVRAISGPEYHIKAAFIYNFAKFVEWSDNNGGSDRVTLCIIPNNPETDVFLSLNNKTVGGKRMEVIKGDYLDLENIGICHILFLDSTDPKFIQETLNRVKDRGILTIGHIKGFTKEGGIINFFIEDGKLKFEVNLDAGRRAGLKLGSQLLMSAEIITGEHK